MDIIPFSYFFIREYTDRSNSTNDTKGYQKYSPIKKIINNKLVSTNYYKVFSDLTNITVFEIRPSYNISYIKAKIEVLDCIYDLSNTYFQKITNLVNRYPYAIYIKTTKNQTININLTMDYKNNKPFEFIKIYEYSSKNNYTFLN